MRCATFLKLLCTKHTKLLFLGNWLCLTDKTCRSVFVFLFARLEAVFDVFEVSFVMFVIICAPKDALDPNYYADG